MLHKKITTKTIKKSGGNKLFIMELIVAIIMVFICVLVFLNPFYTNSKIVTHWWGHDSREVILISELNSWDDIPKAFDKQRELQMKFIKETGGKDFAKQWMALFMPEHHSDEIYRVVAE